MYPPRFTCSKKLKLASRPHTSLPPGAIVETERRVNTPPMLLRRRMSRRRRRTVKLVCSRAHGRHVVQSSMLMAPMVQGPALPVRRPPRDNRHRASRRSVRCGGCRRSCGASLRLAPPPSTAPKLKMPAPSRKNSRFSGNVRLKRVRFTCASSASTWAKSVLYVKSSGQALGHAVLHVETGIGLDVVP